MQKKTFVKILTVIAIILPVLPFIVTFSSILTGIFNRMGWYVWLQDLVVPFEAKLVVVLLKLVNIQGSVNPGGAFSIALDKPDGSFLPVALQWNCLGWQSMILLLLTLTTGIRGSYTRLSKIETVLFGILGTFISNLLRMAVIITLAYYWNDFAAMIIHDYFASFVALIWFIFFWWFSYSFILENKKVGVSTK